MANTSQGTPALIVEVLSPDYRMSQVHRRIAKFLKGGVAVVWIIDPEEQAIMVYGPNGPPKVLEGDEELTGDGGLPEFRSRAADFFAVPAKEKEGAAPPSA